MGALDAPELAKAKQAADAIVANLEATRDLSQIVVHVDMDGLA